MLVSKYIACVTDSGAQVHGHFFHIECVICATVAAVAGQNVNTSTCELTHHWQPSCAADGMHGDKAGL